VALGVFEHCAAVDQDAGALTGGEVPSQVNVGLVSPDFFAALRVSPAMGRGFVAEDHRPAAEVVVISHGPPSSSPPSSWWAGAWTYGCR
jgi:hypothetical protein